MYQVKKPKSKTMRANGARTPEPVDSSLPSSTITATATPRGENQTFGDWLGAKFRVLDRYELQDELVATLRQTKHHTHLVPRVAECHRSFGMWVCEHCHEWVQPKNRCNVRLCPHCQRARALRLAERWTKVLGNCENLRYVVFAERNCTDLAQGLASLYRAWGILRKTDWWKSQVKGSVVVLEVTYNRDDNTWHPHLNILFEGVYIPFQALNQAWIAATRGNGQTSFIKAADTGTIRELLKYVTKLSDFIDRPEAVDHFLQAVARKRFIRTYGTFYRLPVEEEENTGHCPDCGTNCAAYIGPAHPDQIVIDYKGILRVDRSRLRNSQQPATEDIFVTWPRPPVDRTRTDAAWTQLKRTVENQQHSTHRENANV